MIIALCQYAMAWENREENKHRIAALLEARKDMQPFDWLMFSEMSLSGFTMNSDLATLRAEDHAFFATLARRHNANISYGGVEHGYNKCITLDRSGQRINAYSKIHLYAFGGEDQHYRAGTTQEIFRLEGLRVMPTVCFDLRFPYLFWNRACDVDVYVNIAAWPARRAEHWRTLLRARAIENQAYCIGVNRIGMEGSLEYSGNSACFDPMGKPLLDCGDREGLYVVSTSVDASRVMQTRERFPFLKERKSCAPPVDTDDGDSAGRDSLWT